jgi:hypothetical protein
MSWFRKKLQGTNSLIGSWRIDPTDLAAIETFGNVSIEFDDIGNLNYIINLDAKLQVIIMTYRVDGNVIVSNQPSHPDPQRTEFELSSDGVLVLCFDGQPSRFRRSAP